MDLEQAVQAHAQWGATLQAAVRQQGTLDVTTVASDRCCDFGRWLHGEAQSRFAGRRPFIACVERHADFHRAAGSVAAAINQRNYVAASAMLGPGAPFSSASGALGPAIRGLQKLLEVSVP